MESQKYDGGYYFGWCIHDQTKERWFYVPQNFRFNLSTRRVDYEGVECILIPDDPYNGMVDLLRRLALPN